MAKMLVFLYGSVNATGKAEVKHSLTAVQYHLKRGGGTRKQDIDMKSLPFILMALAALSLAGCTGTTVYAAVAATGIYFDRDKPLPPADTAHQIPPHESWCYETMGYPECYTQAQNTDPNRLINVDPQNRYPLTNQDYWETVYASK